MSISATLSAASVLVANIPQPATFQDWTVSCDNMRYCAAQATHDDSFAGNAWVVLMSRDADAPMDPVVTLSPAFDVPDGPARVRFDNMLSEFGITEVGDLVGDPTLFLRAMAKARQADIVDADGKVIGSLAVNGASAALRWMDDRQKRVGTVSALIARGSKPNSAMPPLPGLPEIKTPKRSMAAPTKLNSGQIDRIKEQADCFDAYHEDEFFRLDEAHSLGLIACGTGAYQGFSVAVLINEDGTWSRAPIEQATPLWEGANVWYAASLTTAEYAPEIHLLSSYAKGRGLGDYGMSAAWVWDGEVFRLARYSALDVGRGGPPGEWLPQWQTKNAPLIR